jgi:hypothetical protein
MASQVAIEGRTDVIQLVKQRDKLVVEILIEKARQTERHEIEHLTTVDEISLHPILSGAPPICQLSAAEAHGRDTRLQTVPPDAACLRHPDEETRDINVF